MAGRGVAVLGSVGFFLVAPGIVAGVVPYAISKWTMLTPLLGLQVVRISGGALLALGLGLLLDCFGRFAILGHGTPAPVAAPERLVVSGAYRHVRNPMYVAVIWLVVGQGLLLGQATVLLYGAVVWLLFHAFVVLHEEPTLGRRFGRSYQTYRAEVGRWWPSVRPWTGQARGRVDGIVRATFRTGPVGTGCYLVGGQGPWSEPRQVEVWVLALFFPLLPLSRWRVSAAEGEGRVGDEAIGLTVHSRTRLPLRAVVWRFVRAALATALVALPLAVWASSVGSDWATRLLQGLGVDRLLTALLGSGLGLRLFGPLTMATDIGVLLAGVMIPTLVLLHLDGHRPRVPLRSALGRVD